MMIPGHASDSSMAEIGASPHADERRPRACQEIAEAFA
jgi:hypothetical protein